MTNVRLKVASKERIILVSLFSIIVISISIDLYSDIQENLPLKHFIHELGLLSLSLVAAIYQMLLIFKRDQEITSFARRVNDLETEKAAFKQQFAKVKNDFSQVLDQQFTTWGLTPVEKDIALLLIKGMGMKEISQTRSTSEGTVRQQAATIYRKSGLIGRKELAAFFLDELFS